MKELLKEKWDEIIIFMRNEYNINDVPYHTWIEPLSVFDVKDDTVIISIDDTKNNIPITYVKTKYTIFLRTAIAEITGNDFNIEFVLLSTLKKSGASQDDSTFVEKKINNPFNPLYTFESFVVGPNNSMAHAASLAVAEDPGDIYNPLFIYGGPGLGKTHLMHSIGHYLLENHKNLKIKYVNTNDFTNELVYNIRNNSTAEFRESYRNNDVLIVDDIQFIESRNSTQEEFFQLFNALYESGKQIIISSDRPPKDLKTLNERLVSRFEWGGPIDIQMPDYETRYAILKKKIESMGLYFPDDVIQYMAENFTSNIRSMEGGLKKVIHASRLSKREVNLDLAVDALRDLVSGDSKKELSLPYIVDVVADHYKLTSAEIYSRNRSAKIANARQIIMYLCKQCMDTSCSDIGKALHRDHSSVIHGINKVQKDYETDPEVASTIDGFMRKLKK